MEPTRIFDIPYQHNEKFPKPDALVTKVNGVWNPVSTKEFLDIAEKISYGFLALGVTKGDTIASISTNNRCEFNYIDQGMLQIGAMHVPMYPTISDSDYRYIMNDAEVKYVFVSDGGLYKRVLGIAKDIPSLKGIYTYNEIAGAANWTEVLKLGEKNPQPAKLEELKNSVTPSDVAKA